MSRVIGLDRGQKPALLISECQVGIIGQECDSSLSEQVARRGITAPIARLADVFRTAGLPVIHCTIVTRTGWVVNCALADRIRKHGRLAAGHPGAEIHPDLAPKEGDIVVERCHGMTMFHGTELESILRSHGIDTCVMVGVSTNVALPGSASEAVARFFNVVIAEDATAGGTAETHDMQIRMHLPLLATITTSDRVAGLIESRGEQAG